MNPSAPPDAVTASRLLELVKDPKSGQGLVSAGLVSGLTVGDGKASFMLEVARADAALYAPVRDEAERILGTLPGIDRAQVALTTATPGPPLRVAPPRRTGAAVAADPRANPGAMPPAAPLAHVKRVIAVASGKGGVGKSTVAVNLACAFAGMGLRAGLLDADIYGPSAPRMMGIDAKPTFEDGKLIPLEAWGLKVMSIGFIVEEGKAMIWRGPMVSSAMRQMIDDVRWGGEGDPLDVLVVDLPPGTGDIHLTLVQRLALDGVVIVSTPQEIALIDARRASAMFANDEPAGADPGRRREHGLFRRPGDRASSRVTRRACSSAARRRRPIRHRSRRSCARTPTCSTSCTRARCTSPPTRSSSRSRFISRPSSPCARWRRASTSSKRASALRCPRCDASTSSPASTSVPSKPECATLADLDELVALEARAAAHPWSREVFAEELARDFSYVVVLRDEGKIAAFIVYWVVADELSILDVVTDPRRRRRGHAQRLLEHTIAFGEDRACAKILLEVRHQNVAAQGLYKKNGFRPIGLRADYYADTHEDAIVMELSPVRRGSRPPP